MINLSEIRNRTHKFAKEWKGTTYKRGKAQTYSHLKLLKVHEAIDKLYCKDGLLLRHRTSHPLFEPNQKLISLVMDEPKKLKEENDGKSQSS